MAMNVCLECGSEDVIGGVCQECGAEGNQIKNSNEAKTMKNSNKMSKEELVKKLMAEKEKKAAKEVKAKEVKVEEKELEKAENELTNELTVDEKELTNELTIDEKELTKTEKELTKTENVYHYEVAASIIKNEININPDLKIAETNNASGNSYFSGRTRLFKLLKSKRGISLEINVQLSKEFCKELTGMEDISIATAHAKHLGTMKHHYRNSDSKEVMKIINMIFATFKKNLKKEIETSVKAV